ncbi:MAG: Coenzyme F420 hydrogenase/dehydrogenase, beta subunit C-terminal domain [Desulfobacterota bacterium]|nr:Coenzyme F420 hydrogenase/dehydrogenase, beta subunit C-terminal domain [Thermodesulfobacteriota bacterium]
MNRGLRGLEERVLSKGLCTACGACLSLCPYLRAYGGRVVKLHDCNLDEGRCFSYCPRTDLPPEGIQEYELRQEFKNAGIGRVRRVFMARAKNPLWRERAQSGGAVSALIDVALKERLIEAALLTYRDGDSPPRGRIVRDRAEVLNHAGSSFVSGPTLEALHKGPWREGEKIGVVGLPCQLQALWKMRSSPFEKKAPIDRIELIIGLFCTWALEYEGFKDFLKRRLGKLPPVKMEITPPPERLLKIHTLGGLKIVPIEEIRPFIRKGCHSCPDMTAEHADLSVGTVEGMEGWNTVILRSERGESLFEEARAEGVLETRPLPEENLSHLKEASLLKKERAIKGSTEPQGA